MQPKSTRAPEHVVHLEEQAAPLGLLSRGRYALTFGGQANAYLDELRQVHARSPLARHFIDTIASRVAAHVDALDDAGTVIFSEGFALAQWLGGAPPSADYLTQVPVSFPLIFATQIGHYVAALEAGLERPELFDKVAVIAGHSQGVMAAVCVAENWRRSDFAERAAEYATMCMYFGLRMQQTYRTRPVAKTLVDEAEAASAGMPTPMAALTGMTHGEVQAAIKELGVEAELTIDNTLLRQVISARPETLETLRKALAGRFADLKKRKSGGRFAGRVPDLRWFYLPVSAPFHSSWMADAMPHMHEDARRLGFAPNVADLAVNVIDTATGVPFRPDCKLIDRLIEIQSVRAVAWRTATETLVAQGVTDVLDFGPSDALAKLVQSNVRGEAIAVWPLALESTLTQACSPDVPPPPSGVVYKQLAVRRTGDRAINRYTQLFAKPPVFLAGMTPTTVEAPIVVAAANAGFVAELAGGGQVTERILRLRLDEVQQSLQPGAGIVFNALYLDPYLWKLHFGGDGLVVKLRDEGAPILGVTISAGVPPLPEAAALLRLFAQHGMHMNSFKPGNDRELKEVLALADLVPDISFIVQIEGGKAGGHHSWEALDDLLLRHYGELRSRRNIVLAVGGGIAREAQAVAYLTGTWGSAYGAPIMPVDAVFLGTIAMATREAATSPAVKAALAQAPGTERWVLDGSFDGGVTSGRSQLGASIHYWDNAAARVGALLDSVAGDAAAVATRKDEIAAALATTAKPYFGDLDRMSYAEQLQRLLTLTAIGRGTVYEDGVWPDRSYRQRFAATLRLAEARLSDTERPSLIQTDADVDDPKRLLEAFVAAYPAATQMRVHPDDARAFLAICRQPGKPVCFVPVIDGDVRRWYKSDSLWQAHDARYTADQVLTIPGPAALAGIGRVDEPIADLLGRFEAAIVAAAKPSTEPSLDTTELMRRAPFAVDENGRHRVNPLHASGGRTSLTARAANKKEATLDLHVTWKQTPRGGFLFWDRGAYVNAQKRFFAELLFGGTRTVPKSVVVTDQKIASFGRAVGDASGEPLLTYAFAIAWEGIFAELSTLGIDVMSLLHESNAVRVGPAWPLRSEARVEAKVAGVDRIGNSQRVTIDATIFAGDVVAARITSRFFVRGQTPTRIVADARFEARLLLQNESDARLLREQPWLHASMELATAEILTLVCETFSSEEHNHQATGVLRNEKGVVVATIACADKGALRHPVAVVAELLAAPSDTHDLPRPVEAGTLALTAPSDMAAYARASGDFNPIHVDAGAAQFAGLAAPIVHGMWTASAALARATHVLAAGDATRVRAFDVSFIAPVQLGASLQVRVTKTARKKGASIGRVEVTAGEDLVATGVIEVAPVRTAYVFPGQGIQAPGMGMAGFARSAAARAVWNEAETVCRTKLGFSLLRVVRDNPREMSVQGETVTHPSGVLFLTQFTQVAMVVMAAAQVRELQAEGAFVEDAFFGGHSVGEYSALCAVSRAVPLPVAVEVVYNRGLTMDRLVERDAQGRSPFAMGVVRPHYAGLDEAGMQALVAAVQQATGLPLEIVNYNIRGRQYSVTGHVAALQALAARLQERNKNAQKPAYLEVPGIDVPFHSRLLRDGVAAFRATLDRALPQTIAPAMLVGRYVPNLVAKPFSLDRAFIEEVVAVSGSELLQALLRDFAEAERDPARLARQLLLELLAYQFASPVRWIETQDVLFAPGCVEMFIEVGAAEQPVLSNMALATLSGQASHVQVRNSEAHLAELLSLSVADETPAAPVTAVVATAAPTVVIAAPTGPAVAVQDAPLTVADGLLTLLAQQSRVRLEQVQLTETLDELLGGNSAKRNQVLADVGNEFAVGPIDGAHEKPLADFVKALGVRAQAYTQPGKYLLVAQEQNIAKALGAAKLSRRDVLDYLETTWRLPPGRVAILANRLLLSSRAGESSRGGPLSAHATAGIKDRASAFAWVDAVVVDYAKESGLAVAKPSLGASTGGAVSSEALDALHAKILGQEGLIAKTADLFRAHTTRPRDAGLAVDRTDAVADKLRAYEQEHSDAYLQAVRPIFDAKKHVAFTSAWAWQRRDLLAAYHAAMVGKPITALAQPLDIQLQPTLAALVARAQKLGNQTAAQALAQIAGARSHAIFSATVTGHRSGTATHCAPSPLDLTGKTALVTGAGPGSIASAVLGRMLAAGARVIVTTSTYNPERVRFFRALYRSHARADAELHVVPCNQGSFTDIDALTQWIFASLSESDGGAERKLKGSWVPDIVLPFGAIGEAADLTGIGDRSLATLRVLLLGVERLIARIALGYDAQGVRDRRCHVVLPLSPNHGAFGGDGAYGESKAALEALLDKWQSEQARWGHAIALVGCKIGWVRGTGLMEANDKVADALENRVGLKTFTTETMATAIAGLLLPEALRAASSEPVIADFTAGFGALANLADEARLVREDLDRKRLLTEHYDALCAALKTALRGKTVDEIRVLPTPRAAQHAPVPTPSELQALPLLDHLDPAQVVVVVGYGEVGPWGSARTRWALEKEGKLSLEATAELAWMMGLIEPARDGAGWIDRKSKEAVAEHTLKARYERDVLAHAGIRLVDAHTHDFDPNAALSHCEVHLDEDFSFNVAQREDAEEFRLADPEHTEVHATDGGGFRVLRRRGSKIRVTRALQLSRRVAGQIPQGWDATRYGVPSEMVAQVDRATLFNLIATVEAFVAAGLDPEELYAYLHPARVAITQSSGIGGMGKIRRLYTDFLVGNERQSDAIQETLVNVISGYVVQSYLGSYGAISSPVAACATAALSLADGIQKIRTGTTDFVVTGGCDDYSQEGVIGFADMGATAATDEMLAMGISPAQMSKPNDRRRKGFVEAHGASAILLTRASVALELGLPVHGIVAYAATFSDGINQSVPAPGLGILAAASEAEPRADDDLAKRRGHIAALHNSQAALEQALGKDEAAAVITQGARHYAHHFADARADFSPLRAALAVFGLTGDDIDVVSKHDTSTRANDYNENRLHTLLAQKLQRTPHLPIAVISQKAITGHPKGAAAGWQMNGLLQAMTDSALPPNPNLEDIDPQMREFSSLAFNDKPMATSLLRAGLVTSLGFGHVGGIVCMLHPFFFWRMLSAQTLDRYQRLQAQRAARAEHKLQSVLGGETPLYVRRTQRPFTGAVGSSKQQSHESAMLLDAAARLAPGTTQFPL